MWQYVEMNESGDNSNSKIHKVYAITFKCFKILEDYVNLTKQINDFEQEVNELIKRDKDGTS